MNKSKSTMMLFITSIIFLCLFSNAIALDLPCEADFYLTTCNSSTGIITVDYYKNNLLKCSEVLDEEYTTCPADIGYTQIINMESMDKFNFIMQFLLYFLIAIVLMWIFIKAIGIVNS